MLTHMRSKRKIFILSFLFLAAFVAFGNIYAADFFIAQTATGQHDGSSCGNALPYTWFNTDGNWARKQDEKKIGPGDKVHLCGTISGDGVHTILAVKGSGAHGAPITIHWEDGAKLSLQAGPSNGMINFGNNSHLIFDGGKNGTIENTSNGDHLSDSKSVIGIYGTGSGIQIKNLSFQNLFVKSDPELADDKIVATAIYLTNPGLDIIIENNIFHDLAWAISTGPAAPNYKKFIVRNNKFFDYDHGVTISNGLNDAEVYQNHFGSTAKWDQEANDGAWHHDGIHVYFLSGSLTGVNIYNNTFDGDQGNHATANIFLECRGVNGDINACSNFSIFNNVFIRYPGNRRALSNGCIGGGHPGFRFLNNTFVGDGKSPNTIAIYGLGPSTTFRNNILTGFTTFITNVPPGAFLEGALDSNVYGDQVPGGNAAFMYGGVAQKTFSDWQRATGQEKNSRHVQTVNLNQDGTPMANSPAIGAGANLKNAVSPLLANDKAGRARSTNSSWDVGAYEFTGMKPPTGLRILNTR